MFGRRRSPQHDRAARPSRRKRILRVALAVFAVLLVARFFGLSDLYDFFPTTDIVEYQAVRIDAHDKSQGQIAATIQYNYPILTDDFMFRMSPDRFSELRANYSYRREFYF